MTTDDIEHRPVTRALARELAKEEDGDPESSGGSSSGAAEQEFLESGALRTPQSKRTQARQAPGAPQRRRKKEPRYVAFKGEDECGDDDDKAEDPIRARRELFPAKELAQGYVAIMAIATLLVALALSFFQPLDHIKMPEPFDGTTASRFSATLLCMFALGLIASNGMPLDLPSK